MSFNENQKLAFQEKLEQVLKDVNEQIKNLEKNVDFGDDVDPHDEEADEVEEKGNLAGIKNSLQNRQQKIAKALLKIKGGGYGLCEKCSQDIDSELLNIDPESELCRNCKKTA